MSAAEIVPSLSAVNAARCRPALEEREVHGIAQSVGRYAPAEQNGGGYVLHQTPWVPGQASRRQLVLTAAAEIRSDRIPWLELDRIPQRGLTVVAGEKGLGKSTLTSGRLAAMVTRGSMPVVGDRGRPGN